jgi:hypothetical protein
VERTPLSFDQKRTDSYAQIRRWDSDRQAPEVLVCAYRAKVHQTYLSGVERGIRNPTVLVLAKIAKALGVEADELLRNPTDNWSLEQNPTDLNREGFPSGANSDSHCVLGKEASTHGQAIVGGFADQGGPSG